MKKLLLSMVLIFCIGILSSCTVTEKYDEYERKQFSSTDEITKIIVIDFSMNYTI